MKVELTKVKGIRGQIAPPPDKSISHRAVMFSCLSKGQSTVSNILKSEDVLSTISVFRALGVEIDDRGSQVVINGTGIEGLKEPVVPLYCGNSGTTMRLMSGILSGMHFLSILTGDQSLNGRPMGRVIKPLTQMGAQIMARDDDRYAPMAIRGGNLNAIKYDMPISSAQVKSCVLLAGLVGADGVTEVVEKERSRDHTERMLPGYGVSVEVDGLSVRIKGRQPMTCCDVAVPNDFSSAAFFIAAATIVPGSELMVRDVCINPTRTGLLEVLASMGAKVRVQNQRFVSGEPVADIVASSADLKGADVPMHLVPSLIDEFPILCILAAMAQGRTTIRGAKELRVKESDRISAMAQGLKAMGVTVQEFEDGMAIEGAGALKGAQIESFADHRIAMSFAVASLVASGTTTINEANSVDISFPGFFDELRKITIA